MKKIKYRLLFYIINPILSALFVWIVLSFLNWNINPNDWSGFARFFGAMIGIIFFLSIEPNKPNE